MLFILSSLIFTFKIEVENFDISISIHVIKQSKASLHQ